MYGIDVWDAAEQQRSWVRLRERILGLLSRPSRRVTVGRYEVTEWTTRVQAALWPIPQDVHEQSADEQ